MHKLSVVDKANPKRVRSSTTCEDTKENLEPTSCKSNQAEVHKELPMFTNGLDARNEADISRLPGARSPLQRVDRFLIVGTAATTLPKDALVLSKPSDPDIRTTLLQKISSIQCIPEASASIVNSLITEFQWDFFNNALIWIPGTQITRKPSWKAWVPRRQQLHTLDSLLAGCGWCENNSQLFGVEKGIIIIEPHAKDWGSHALERLKGEAMQGRPIYILDVPDVLGGLSLSQAASQ